MNVLIFSVLVASIAYLIADSEVAIPLRTCVRNVWPFAGRALSCHICTCYWIAFVIMAAVPNNPLFWWLPAGSAWLCDSLVVAFGGGVVGALFKRLVGEREV